MAVMKKRVSYHLKLLEVGSLEDMQKTSGLPGKVEWNYHRAWPWQGMSIEAKVGKKGLFLSPSKIQMTKSHQSETVLFGTRPIYYLQYVTISGLQISEK